MLLGNKLAPRRGVEPLYSARQADIIDRYMNEANLVEVVGVEATMFLMWRIYSPLPSTNSAHTSIKIIIHSPAMPVN